MAQSTLTMIDNFTRIVSDNVAGTVTLQRYDSATSAWINVWSADASSGDFSLQNQSNFALNQMGLSIDVIRDYNASGSSFSTTGTMALSSTTLTIGTAGDFTDGQGISVAGAASGGGLLITSIVSGAGTTSLVLANAAGTAVTNAAVNHDDTVALQNAITASLGKTCIVPPGTFNVSTALTFPGACNLVGTTNTRGGLGSRIVGTQNGTVLSIAPDNVSIRHLEFIGPYQTTYTEATAIAINGASVVTLSDCYFDGWYNSIYITGTGYYNNFDGLDFYDCVNAHIYGTTTGSDGYGFIMTRTRVRQNDGKYSPPYCFYFGGIVYEQRTV